MDKLTIGLISVAAAIGLISARGARSLSTSPSVAGSGARTPSATPAEPLRRDIDPGMAVLRNDHIDDGIAVRSPFDGDRGMARRPSSPGEKTGRQNATTEI
jgi:hypothetical protein